MAKKSQEKQEKELFKNKLVPAKAGSGELFEVDYDYGSEPVECLGIQFANDGARRAHFLNLLAEKLKETDFRKMPGFPLGDDEHILAMSDPPYYTACPNPFLKDFVEHHGTQYDPKTKYHREPFTADVSEGKTDSIYTAHSYHTKVPHKAIMRYLLHYTDPGDVVFDGFCGTGMTGVAAQLCGSKSAVEGLGYRVSSGGEISEERPNPEGKAVATTFSSLGARKAVLNDLAPIATFIASNYGSPVDAKALKKEGTRILSEIEDEFGWMYETLHSDGKTKGRIEYTVWSEVFSCEECGGEIVFVDEALDSKSGKVKKAFPCPHCGVESSKNNLTLLYESKFDSALDKPVPLPRRVPVAIHYSAKGSKYVKTPDDFDMDVLKRVDDLPMPTHMPMLELPDMQMRRVGRMKPANITHLHHFFLPRPSHILSALWERASQCPERRLKNMLLFFVEQAVWGMSVLNRYSPSHFSQTNRALSGVFYVASQLSEVSPWYNLEGKLKRLSSAFASHMVENGNQVITTQDLASVCLAEDSIDYIFTDPPFGENIYYSDLNILIESWHDVRTAPLQEAIVDRVKDKTLLDYQHLMSECFKNYCRVLKPGRWMTVEFHNSRNSVWNAIQEALENAGFVVADVRTLDKKQGSFQQVVSGNTVKRDLIISAYKPNGGLENRFKEKAGTEDGAWDFVNTHLNQLPVFVVKAGKIEPVAERQGNLLFDRMVAFHVQRGVSVPLSSAEFRAELYQKFPERDGMHFLPEQVEEYDRKRMTVEKVAQLELFVSDEASAIQWLKQQLKQKPQSFQELQPQFMKEVAGWEKHERTLELSELLDQNFLCYDDKDDVPSQIHGYLSSNFKDVRNLPKGDPKLKAKAKGRWYVPDPRKEVDLEKIRHRALMKEFNEYREATKKKLKTVRTEALRAGFKECWQKNDYKAIVEMAERVREEIIQEDPALLMYYDNAVMLSGE
ncbi:DNA methylase [Symmachiella dynata]|uniref:DNA methylase n=1 Tax=Symmachiella dynata TaxID=2527995 RepID=A0A517ZY28_9PLAN|nr:DNA methyltransferase [Symmachiella dynata]QDU47377.1 DNA methylase [Symmachiella dynata]